MTIAEDLHQDMTTKETIIFEALKLFSTNGFDSVSTRMIARAVGASDAVIYKHFRSKQEILDTIVEICKQRFAERIKTLDIQQMTWEDMDRICIDMFRFQTEDEWIVMFRKLLIVEQFKNPKMEELYKAFFVDGEINTMTQVFDELIQLELIKNGNPKVYAMELYAPFFMYHTIQSESEVLIKELQTHVKYFRDHYKTTETE